MRVGGGGPAIRVVDEGGPCKAVQAECGGTPLTGTRPFSVPKYRQVPKCRLTRFHHQTRQVASLRLSPLTIYS